MHKYAPLSINPQLTNQPSLLSPVSLLSNQPTPIKQQLLKQNTKLKQQYEELLEQLAFRKQKNDSLRTQLLKQEKKMCSWKQCYEKSEEEYIDKKQFIEVLEQKLKSLKENSAKDVYDAPRKMAMQDQEISEGFKQNDDSFKLSKKFSNQDRFMTFLPKMNRVNSIAMERKKSKRKQALSLTHLHKYNYGQNY